jgi:hypothetical protein
MTKVTPGAVSVCWAWDLQHGFPFVHTGPYPVRPQARPAFLTPDDDNLAHFLKRRPEKRGGPSTPGVRGAGEPRCHRTHRTFTGQTASCEQPRATPINWRPPPSPRSQQPVHPSQTKTTAISSSILHRIHLQQWPST